MLTLDAMRASFARALPLFALLAAGAAAGQPAPRAIEPSAIGRVARHGGPFEVKEGGTAGVGGSSAKTRWSALVVAPDKSFADLHVVLLDGGTYLTPELMQRLDAGVADPQRYAAVLRTQSGAAAPPGEKARVLQQFDRLSAEGPLVRAVSLPNGRRGYTALLSVGSADATCATILPSPDGTYDLVVSLSTPFDPSALTRKPEAARYQSMLERVPLDALEPMAVTVYRQLFPPQRAARATPPKTP